MLVLWPSTKTRDRTRAGAKPAVRRREVEVSELRNVRKRDGAREIRPRLWRRLVITVCLAFVWSAILHVGGPAGAYAQFDGQGQGDVTSAAATTCASEGSDHIHGQSCAIGGCAYCVPLTSSEIPPNTDTAIGHVIPAKHLAGASISSLFRPPKRHIRV